MRMLVPPLLPRTRWIASRQSRCAGDMGTGITGAGAAVIGAGVTAIGAGVATIGAGGTAATGEACGRPARRWRSSAQEAANSRGLSSPSEKKNPARAGFIVSRMPLSKRSAAAVTPGEAVRAASAARHHHDGPLDHTRSNHNDTAIGTASAIGTSMEARAASAGRIRRTKARDRACNQSCSEKVLHVFSMHAGPHRGTEQ
jgi:hypothetical protein